jgi:hypothetical protein
MPGSGEEKDPSGMEGSFLDLMWGELNRRLLGRRTRLDELVPLADRERTDELFHDVPALHGRQAMSFVHGTMASAMADALTVAVGLASVSNRMRAYEAG